MIKIWLNGKEENIETELSLELALSQWAQEDRQYAVAVNEQFVPKSDYASKVLTAGDRIELLAPMQGG